MLFLEVFQLKLLGGPAVKWKNQYGFQPKRLSLTKTFPQVTCEWLSTSPSTSTHYSSNLFLLGCQLKSVHNLESQEITSFGLRPLTFQAWMDQQPETNQPLQLPESQRHTNRHTTLSYIFCCDGLVVVRSEKQMEGPHTVKIVMIIA